MSFTLGSWKVLRCEKEDHSWLSQSVFTCSQSSPLQPWFQELALEEECRPVLPYMGHFFSSHLMHGFYQEIFDEVSLLRAALVGLEVFPVTVLPLPFVSMTGEAKLFLYHWLLFTVLLPYKQKEFLQQCQQLTILGEAMQPCAESLMVLLTRVLPPGLHWRPHCIGHWYWTMMTKCSMPWSVSPLKRPITSIWYCGCCLCFSITQHTPW